MFPMAHLGRLGKFISLDIRMCMCLDHSFINSLPYIFRSLVLFLGTQITKSPQGKNYPSLILYYFVHCVEQLDSYLTCNRCCLIID